MGIIKINLKKFLWATNWALNLPITIQDWYGRLGNNIQQISLAIMYAKINGFRVITPEHPNIASVSYGSSKFWNDKFKIKNRFFFIKFP